MPTVVAVRLRYNSKSYWFDPNETTPAIGDHVLVETERSREIGLVVNNALEVTDKQIEDLSSPLKPIVRVLSEEDHDRIDELAVRGREAMPVFREFIEKRELDMQPVEVEFLFSGDKAVFYFTSENRIDFRDLVRDLAAHFHVRIDMRQIGARDEARMVGGLAHCGEVLCCTRIGGELETISIRMAKEQDLSLNPVKISGACGRLMCCLRYEFEAYKDFKQRAPKKNTLVETPLGLAKVTDFNTPREIINMRLEDGKQLSVPLADLECERDSKGSICKCRAGREAIDRCASSSILLALGALDRESEKEMLLADADDPMRARAQVRRRHHSGEDTGATAAQSEAPARQGQEQKQASPPQQDKQKPAQQKQDGSRPRRRFSKQRGQQQGQQQDRQQPSQQDVQQQGRRQGRQQQDSPHGTQSRRPRPGQNSSGLRNPQSSGRPDQQSRPSNQQQGQQGERQRQRQQDGQRPTRRRRHRSDGAQNTSRSSDSHNSSSAGGTSKNNTNS